SKKRSIPPTSETPLRRTAASTDNLRHLHIHQGKIIKAINLESAIRTTDRFSKISWRSGGCSFSAAVR
ncbi:hypothetical protein LINPERHAP1_LOCUS17183, partial [Linum perenne]